jgi:alpha-beta hydrolase superfamily lysophospholipase
MNAVRAVAAATILAALPAFAVPARPGSALLAAIRVLPGVTPDRIVLFGHSRGGGLARNVAQTGGAGLCGVVLESAGYPPTPDDAVRVRVPVLILHGTENVAGEGGSQATDVERARTFERALRATHTLVDAVYYPGVGHNGVFQSAEQRADVIARVLAFGARCGA